MSRDIYISYELLPDGPKVDIEVRAPFYLFGTQRTSMTFWSLPDWSKLGVKRLAELGVSDPIYFYDWDMMDELNSEIRIFQDNITMLPFYPELKAQWLSHILYCYHLLIMTAPKDSRPLLTIG